MTTHLDQQMFWWTISMQSYCNKVYSYTFKQCEKRCRDQECPDSNRCYTKIAFLFCVKRGWKPTRTRTQTREKQYFGLILGIYLLSKQKPKTQKTINEQKYLALQIILLGYMIEFFGAYPTYGAVTWSVKDHGTEHHLLLLHLKNTFFLFQYLWNYNTDQSPLSYIFLAWIVEYVFFKHTNIDNAPFISFRTYWKVAQLK
jgi:hypothetical protein